MDILFNYFFAALFCEAGVDILLKKHQNPFFWDGSCRTVWWGFIFLNTNYKKQRSCFELFSFLKSIKKHASKCFFQTLSKQRHLKKVKNRIVVFIFENTPEKWTIRINIYKISEIQKILASWVWTKTRFARVSSIIFCRGYEIMVFCRGWMVRNQRKQNQRVSINSTISEHFWKKFLSAFTNQIHLRDISESF